MTTKSKVAETSANDVMNKSISEKVSALETALAAIQNDLADALGEFYNISGDSALSDADRRRLLGSGVRRYGFMDKVSDVGLANTDFAPPFLNLATLKDLMRHIETLRNISTTLQQLVRLNGDLLLTAGDDAYRMALLYYTAVREAARGRVPGAKAIFDTLRLFFKRTRNASSEPTEPEVERDVKALLHGKKDGKIIIENETPHTKGGKHVVVDETYNDKADFRESESGEIVE